MSFVILVRDGSVYTSGDILTSTAGWHPRVGGGLVSHFAWFPWALNERREYKGEGIVELRFSARAGLHFAVFSKRSGNFKWSRPLSDGGHPAGACYGICPGYAILLEPKDYPIATAVDIAVRRFEKEIDKWRQENCLLINEHLNPWGPYYAAAWLTAKVMEAGEEYEHFLNGGDRTWCPVFKGDWWGDLSVDGRRELISWVLDVYGKVGLGLRLENRAMFITMDGKDTIGFSWPPNICEIFGKLVWDCPNMVDEFPLQTEWQALSRK